MNEEQAQDLANQIRKLAPELDRLSRFFRINPDTGKEYEFDLDSSNDWRRDTYGNVLVRLRQLTEKNVLFVETLGLLAVTRYIFEVHVWLRLFKEDDRFCLVYRRELLDTMLRYYRDTLRQLEREIDFLKSIHEKEKRSTNDTLSMMRTGLGTEDDVATDVQNTMQSIDNEASRRFSIYAEDAKTNGYGFQAYIVKSQAIPKTKHTIREIYTQLKDIPEHIRDFCPGRWQWRQMAKRVGMVHEYDYIYRYLSKLLHATPASITTDQKNLEFREMCMFLRYIRLKLMDIIDLAREQSELGS